MGALAIVPASAISSLVEVEDRCAQVEQWAEQCQSVPELRDAGNKLAAIDEYLARTSTEGRARVAAAMRRLEIRIGQLTEVLVSRDEQGHIEAKDDGLTRIQRHEFRQMAEHHDLVEDVIAESTDEAPASRRKVMGRISEVSTARMDRVRDAMGVSDAPSEAADREPYFEALRALGKMEHAIRGINAKASGSASAGDDRLVETADRCDRLIKWLTAFKGALSIYEEAS